MHGLFTINNFTYGLYNYVVDGGWSSWTYGPCSKTCGGGIQNYTRVCDNPKPSCGGKECDGPSTDVLYKNCNDFSCSGKIVLTTSIISNEKSCYSYVAMSRRYRKREKICWVKLSWVPPNEVFHRKTFEVPYV